MIAVAQALRVLLGLKEGKYGEFEVKKRYASNHGFETSLDQLTPFYEVYASRIIPGNEYQFIGLNLMYEVAKQEGGVTFDNPDGLSTLQEHIKSVETNADLKDFNNYALKTIKNYAMVGGKYKIQLQDCPQLTPTQCQTIYRNYIHNTLIAQMGGHIVDGTKDYFVNGSDRNNKDANFRPRRIITQDNQGWWRNRSATDRATNS